MGSFNISCGVSDLAIERGERVGVVLLTNDYPSQARGHGYSGSKLYDTEPTKVYRPCFPPIFARYDDYGNFKDIEESGVTRYLEEHFQRPILGVLNAVGDTRKLYENRSTVGTLYMSSTVRELLDNPMLSTEEKLLSIGFVKDELREGELEAYRFEGARLSLSELVTGAPIIGRPSTKRWIATQGESPVFEHSDRANLTDILSALSELTYLAPGFEQAEQVLALRQYSGMAFLTEAVDPVVAALKKERYYADRLNDTLDGLNRFFSLDFTPEFLQEVRELEDTDTETIARCWDSFRRSSYVQSELRVPWYSLESLRSLASAQELISGKELEFALFALNRRFQPTMVAEEWDSDTFALVMNQAKDAILRRRMYDRDEDLDEHV